MSSRIITVKFLSIVLFLLLDLSTILIPAQKEKKSIFVVAIRDGSLFTLCCDASDRLQALEGSPRTPADKIRLWKTDDGLQTIFVLPPLVPDEVELHQLPAPSSHHPDRMVCDRNWQEFIGKAPSIGPSGKTDSELESLTKKAFLRQKVYQIAESVQEADLVFLVEGIYTDLTVYRVWTEKGYEYQKYWSESWSRNANFRQLIMAVAVPADFYRQNPADSQALLRAGLWQGWIPWGLVRSRTPFQAATPEALVKQFCENKRSPAAIPVICPSWAPPTFTYPEPGVPKTTNQPGSSAAKDLPPRSTAIKVEVTMITVPVVVTDKSGNFVSDLKPSEFHLFEDGKEQKLDRVLPGTEPLNVALLMDTSGSTRRWHTDIRDSALAFLEALRPEDRIMVMSIGGRIYKESELTTDHAQIQRAILNTKTTGGTRIFDSLNLAMTEGLDRVPGRKVIVLFTDGIDTASWFADAHGIQAMIERSDVLVHVVQYNFRKTLDLEIVPISPKLLGSAETTQESFDKSEQFLQNLTQGSGGRLYQADEIAGLKDAFNQMASELRQQYTLCYYAGSQLDTTSYRTIRVVVDRLETRVRHRQGYRVTQTLDSRWPF